MLRKACERGQQPKERESERGEKNKAKHNNKIQLILICLNHDFQNFVLFSYFAVLDFLVKFSRERIASNVIPMKSRPMKYMGATYKYSREKYNHTAKKKGKNGQDSTEKI